MDIPAHQLGKACAKALASTADDDVSMSGDEGNEVRSVIVENSVIDDKDNKNNNKQPGKVAAGENINKVVPEEGSSDIGSGKLISDLINEIRRERSPRR